VRAILKQFQIDFTSYRFATTERGLEVSFTLTNKQTLPEMVVLQCAAQIYALLPTIPALSLHVTFVDGSVVTIDDITATTLTSVVEQFTEKTLADLFVVNKQNPFGKRTTKGDGSGHHYIGDLVYSQFGDYNPWPVLAAVHATLARYPLVGTIDASTGIAATADVQFYNDVEISYLYPQTWSTRSLDAQTTLLYTSETTFASAAAWSEFGVTVKRYAAPNVTLAQWLLVNRSDRPSEDLPFSVHQPLVGKHIITGNTYSDEYIVWFEDTVYVITVERSSDVTELDRAYLQTLISTFSANYALQRN
jgi:hypothetical protein